MKVIFDGAKKLFALVVGLLCIFSCRMDVDSKNERESGDVSGGSTVEYSIKHFVESLDGVWTEQIDDRSSGHGTTASTTELTESDAKTYEGFSFSEVKNTSIAADGSSVVEFYYTRNTYTLTFDAGEGEFGDGSKSVTRAFKYGQQIEPPIATRQGYSAVWADSGLCPAENATYTVTWLEENETLYTIKHFAESLDGLWTEQIDDRSSGHGTTASTTELTESDAKSYEGFSFSEVKNTSIAGDGSSVVEFYYTRNTYTLTFDAGEGEFDGGTKSVTKSFKYGEAVVAPTATRQGYGANWSTGDCPAENASYTVTWVPDESTSYFIIHFIETLDGNWSEKSVDRSTGHGKTGDLTACSESDAKSYSGFTLKEVKNVDINGNGSSQVSFYYTRNTYTLTFDAGEGEFDGGAKSVTRTLKYGATIEIPSACRHGYSASWSGVPNVCPAENAAYTVTWIEGNATRYAIKHFVEDLDGGWTERTEDSGTGQGKTGSMTTCADSDAKSYRGFSFSEVKNTSIAADGSSVVEFYYTRETYTLTFDAGEGEFEGGKKTVAKDLKYEAPVEIPSANRPGYSASWTGVPNLCPAENATYTATWDVSENTPYKIKHFLMDVDGRNWTERTEDESSRHGMTNAHTTFTESDAKSYTGFVFYEVKNTTISEDGSSVVEFYYRRNYYTISFVAEGGTFADSVTLDSSGNATVNVIYGGTVTAPIVTRTGYEVSWPAFETCTGPKTYTAAWTPRTDTPYTVEHWRQNANDDEYTIYGSPVPMTGKTGEKTKANAKNSTGFALREPLAQQQVEIAADGSTVVKIYYDRKTFEITFDAGDGVFLGAGENGEDISSFTKTYRYYQKTPALTPFKDGFVATWSPKDPKNQYVTASTTYSVTWEAGTEEANYSIQHFQEAVDGTYGTKPKLKETKSGLAGSMTKLTESDAQVYTGFSVDRIENIPITKDGKAVAKIYYKRNICKLTFNAGEGRFSDGSNVLVLEGRYGAAVPIEVPTRDFWKCTAWFTESSTAHLEPEFGTASSAIKTFPPESKTYEAKWDAIFKLSAAVDDKGNDVLSKFSTKWETVIEVHDQDFYLSGGSNPRWLSAKPTIVGCRFYHVDATTQNDEKHYNAFWGTDAKVDLVNHKISGTFYGQKMETQLSDDYNAITFTIQCKGLYTERGGSPFGLGKGNPFGKSGSYTLTFTRK